VGDPEETGLARFELAEDGSSFSVDNATVAAIVAALEAPVIESVTGMDAEFTPRGEDDFENMRSRGQDGVRGSQLIARVTRRLDGTIENAADIWAHNDSPSEVNSGVFASGMFAWGTTITQSDLDALNNVGGMLSFTGVMSVDNATVAAINVDMGPDASWNGTWTNPSYDFSAGGGFLDANFVSSADQFSDNVQSGFVQGVLQGPLGNNSIAHIIEVDLDEVGLVRDIGLLTQADLP
jgi:hypothetical protein